MSNARSGACRHLLSMPHLREVQLREGVLEEMITTNRPQNIEAILGYSRGNIAEEGCEQCIASLKPFAHCVVVSGLFQGSCSSCHYNSTGKGCSFRTTGMKYNKILIIL